MKTFTKTALTLITASVLTTSAFASSDDNAFETLQSSRSSVEALAATLGVDSSVDLNGAYTFSQKAAVYDAKYDELQNKFNLMNAQ